MPEKIAPRQLYIGLDNKSLLEQIDRAIEAEHGPNSRKFSEWMLDAARLKLAGRGESPAAAAVRHVIREELPDMLRALLRTELAEMRTELGRVVSGSGPDQEETDDDEVAQFLGGISDI